MNTNATIATNTTTASVWLAADIVNGVYQIDPIDIPESARVDNPRDFYEALRWADDGERLFTAADLNDAVTLLRIEEEYGIEGMDPSLLSHLKGVKEAFEGEESELDD